MAIFNKETYGEFICASLVDWNEPERVRALQKNLEKSFKKRIRSKKVVNNRINTFSISQVDFSEKVSSDQRTALEVELREKFAEYSQKLLKLYRSQMIYKEDENIFNEIFKYFKLKSLSTQLDKQMHDSIEKVENQIENLVSHAFVGIWDLHHNNNGRVILADRTIKIPNGKANPNFEISSIIDELIITNFGIHFLPFSYKLIKNMNSIVFELNRFVEKQLNAELDKHLLPVLRNMIGSLSGLQEVLKLLKRQISQVNRILLSTVEELNVLISDDLTKWLEEDIANLKQFSSMNNNLNNLETQISEIKGRFRSLLKKTEDTDYIDCSPRDGSMEEFFIKLVVMKSEITALRLWVNRFEDIPSFTTLGDGIAYEVVENEVYTPKSKNAILESSKLFKLYKSGSSSIYVLRGIDIVINRGEFVIIRGPSGSGKTTLLNLLSGLDNANRGAVFFNGKDFLNMKDKYKTKIRRDHFAFIFQNYALIPHLTATENVKVPLELSGLSRKLKDGIIDILREVGIDEYATHKPALLSGGQMQRLGIARALIAKPDVIFADEPTGDLDEKTGTKIMELLKKYHEETGITIVMVTHNKEFTKYGTKEVYVKDGQII